MTRSYKTRTVFVFFIFCALYLIILFNLYLIQVKQSAFFSYLGKKQYNVTVSRYAARAEIFDRNGQPLALNKDCLSAFILPNQLKNPKKTKQFLQKEFPHAYKALQKNTGKKFMFVHRNLTTKQKLLVEQAKIEDIKLLHERGRFYPAAAAATVVGTTNIDNKGLFGIEFQCNDQLGGTPAIYSLEQEARSGNFHFKKETQQKGKAGKPIRLTIDSDLQFLAHDELNDSLEKWNAKEGAVVVMDPKTGEILAMVSAPAFDPNDMTNIDLQTTKNKVVTESYEFGSIAKTFAALAALAEGAATLEEKIDCCGKKTGYVDGRKVNTLVAHGVLSFSEVVELSNNIGIAKVAKRINEKLYDHYIKIGLGKKTGIEFPGEQSGFVNHPANWSKQSLISLSYGYEMTCTLLQIAQAFCMIARDGAPVKPKLIFSSKDKINSKKSSVTLGKKHAKEPRLYDKQTIDLLKEILENTTLRGTAKRARINGYRVMSKTGTANLLVDGQYDQEKNIYTCAGIVQKNNYQRVIVAFVREAQKDNAYASTVAAPLFGRIAQKIVIHDKIV